MAGNNSIQFLRGSGHSSSAQLLPGQPYYDYSNNQLYIGGSNGTAINQAKAIGSELGSPIYEHVYRVTGLWTATSAAVTLNAYTKYFSSSSPNSDAAKQDMLNLIMGTNLGNHSPVIASGVLTNATSSGFITTILCTISYVRNILSFTGFSSQKSIFVESSIDLSSYSSSSSGIQLAWVSSTITGYV